MLDGRHQVMPILEILKTLLLGYPVTPDMLDADYPLLVQAFGGMLLTLVLTVISLTAGAIFGLVLAVMREAPIRPMSGGTINPASIIARVVSSTAVGSVQGLPLMMIVLIVYYYPFVLFHARVPGVLLAMVALSVFAGAYMCEIIRSGFRAVDAGLVESAKVLGLSRSQTLWSLKIPLASRVMLPAIVGLAVTIFIDSSVLVVVAVPDLMYTARQMAMADPRHYPLIFGIVLAIYWTVASAGSVVVEHMERKWDMRISR